MKTSKTESPDAILVRVGTDISYRAYELQRLVNTIQDDLYEILQLSNAIHSGSLSNSSIETLKCTEEIDRAILVIHEKGRYFTALGHKLCFGPLAPPPFRPEDNKED